MLKYKGLKGTPESTLESKPESIPSREHYREHQVLALISTANNNNSCVGDLYVSLSYCQFIVLCRLWRIGQTTEQRCNMTCVAGGQAWAPFCKDLFQVSPPMNGTIGHFNNKQHMLLEFSNSQQYRTALCRSIQCFAMAVSGCAAAAYYLGRRCVASAGLLRPTLLGFSLSPQPGEVSRSRSHSVSRTGP